jgi:ribosomal protein L11 methyltransferase
MNDNPVTVTVLGLGHDHAVALAAEIDERWGEALAIAVNETDEAAAIWNVIVYCGDKTQAEGLRRVLMGWDARLGESRIDGLPDTDWVRKSLEGLQPVRAGRFFIFGAHDRRLRHDGGIAIEIGAGTAFGTGHHGTTAGCLLALDAILKKHRPRNVLDVGCGTGVLAIAAAKALSAPVLATDIDPEAVAVTRNNARANDVARLVKTATAPGLSAPLIRQAAPFGLIFANILARPLIGLAGDLSAALARGGCLILSGITCDQEHSIKATYRNRGLRPLRVLRLGNWVTLIFTK